MNSKFSNGNSTSEKEDKIAAIKEIAKALALTYDRVLILPDPTETRSSGGIIIPDTAQEKPKKGTVLAVGAGNYDEHKPFSVPGARVVYGKYAGSEFKINGVEVIMMRDNDVWFAYPPNAELNITM